MSDLLAFVMVRDDPRLDPSCGFGSQKVKLGTHLMPSSSGIYPDYEGSDRNF